MAYGDYYDAGLAPEESTVFLLVARLGFLVGLLGAAFAMTAGLIYLAELAEDHPSVAKRVFRWTLLGVGALWAVLLLSGAVPWWKCLLSLCVLFCYAQLLPRFPYVDLSRPLIWVCGAGAALEHVVWWLHFQAADTPRYPYWAVVSFYFLFVWLTPVGLCCTLSNEAGLPGGGAGFGDAATRDATRDRGVGAKRATLMAAVKAWLPQRMGGHRE